MPDEWATVSLQHDPMQIYRSKRDLSHRSVASKYDILGFISSGTYGRVYKAQSRDLDEDGRLYAIKKFKPDKEGDVVTYTGLSQSAIREIALNREIKHENVAALKEVILEDKSIYMVFEYAEHDFLQLIHHHSQIMPHHTQSARNLIAPGVLKSLVYQLLNGLLYLHSVHILHRDLKPANILITSSGIVKIGDLGLARLIYEPLQPLFAGDKVVVTIWYRSPELLLGAKHYIRAVDCWAVGCVIAEMLSLRPIFKGEEAKLDSKKNVPFQRDQLIKIFEVLGTPNEKDWPGVRDMPEYQNMLRLDHFSPCLAAWTKGRMKDAYDPLLHDLLRLFFIYDPEKRLTAKDALQHRWFHTEPKPTKNAFEHASTKQLPGPRNITQDDTPTMAMNLKSAQNTSHQHGRIGVSGHIASQFGQGQSKNPTSNSQTYTGGAGPTRKKQRLC